jgi:pimeloyl-ACP methyl ester carboxylesterase
MSPAVHDLMNLRLCPAVLEDLCDSLEVLLEQPEIGMDTPVGIFSVSVGSLAALRLASSRAHAHRISRVVCFGGYAERERLLSWLLRSEDPGSAIEHRDPLNQPLAFLTIVDHLTVPILDVDALCAGWRRYVRLTWPRSELKSPHSSAHIPIARLVAGSLCPGDRELFLIGCGALPGARSLCDRALERGQQYYDFLDPTADIGRLQARVLLVHGVGDPVIPFCQLGALASAIPGANAVALQLYGHSARTSPPTSMRRVPALARDTYSLMRIVHALM